jgi:hypothetical protein
MKRMAIAVARRSLQAAAAALGNGETFIVNGRGAAALQVTGTFVGTVTFEGAVDKDNPTWVAIRGTSLNDGSKGTTATTAGIWILSTVGLEVVRARVSAYTSGSITVVGREIDGAISNDDLSLSSTNVSYTTATHTTLGVTTSSQTALAANTSRKYALFVNNSDTEAFLKIGATAVANEGIRLNAYGGSYEMLPSDGSLNTGAVNVIHGGTGSKTLLITEGV